MEAIPLTVRCELRHHFSKNCFYGESHSFRSALGTKPPGDDSITFPPYGADYSTPQLSGVVVPGEVGILLILQFF